MLARVVESRAYLAFLLAGLTGGAFYFQHPVDGTNGYLQLVAAHSPTLYQMLTGGYALMCFSTPFIAYYCALALLYVLVRPAGRVQIEGELPPYPEPRERDELFLVGGELHNATSPTPSARPIWLKIKERALYTGLLFLGRIGSGKSSGGMLACSEQLLGYKADDPERRIGGLFMEVKGDFTVEIRAAMQRQRRADQPLIVGYDPRYCYNPLISQVSPYSAAFQVAQLISAVWGKSKEPFWPQAYTNLNQFVVLLHRLLYGYLTLTDLYASAIDPTRLHEQIKEGERRMHCQRLAVVPAHVFEDARVADKLKPYGFLGNDETQAYTAPLSDALLQRLEYFGFEHRVVDSFADGGGAVDQEWRKQFEAVRRWYYGDWLRIHDKLRTSIVEGISVFLSVFDANPAMKRIFCPPQEAYDPAVNAPDQLGRYPYGEPLAPFAELIERGTVVGLNFPVAEEPGLAITIATLMKLDFQRACLLRIPRMAADPGRTWRPVILAMDEYHLLATCGGRADPGGDDAFFSLSRAARVIPLAATQSVSSLRKSLDDAADVILQTFGGTFFLTTQNPATMAYGAQLSGKEDKPFVTRNVSETATDAGVSYLAGGRTLAGRGNVSASRTYTTRIDDRFRAGAFGRLRNFEAIFVGWDGSNPIPASYCYLLPHFLPKNITWFEKRRRDLI